MLDVCLIMKCYLSHRKSKHYFNNCKIFLWKIVYLYIKNWTLPEKCQSVSLVLLKYERICPIFCLLTIFRTVFCRRKQSVAPLRVHGGGRSCPWACQTYGYVKSRPPGCDIWWFCKIIKSVRWLSLLNVNLCAVSIKSQPLAFYPSVAGFYCGVC